MNDDYQRIERAIRYLQAHVTEQPGLEALAREVHLSPAHCQRLFRRWAGVSPKRFLQFLTVDYAKRMLAGASVLETAHAAGLSGGSRLHEHFVVVEAATPGQFKRAGEGMRITCGVADSRFGAAWLAETGRGICALEFIDGDDGGRCLERLRRRWPKAEIARDDARAAAGMGRLLDDPGERPLLVKGSNFQIQVWQALLRIPPGKVCSYRQLAEAVGRPTASRAVAQAVGANPVAWIIPCHRVLRATGALGGYRWGISRKQAMLAWEAAKYGE